MKNLEPLLTFFGFLLIMALMLWVWVLFDKWESLKQGAQTSILYTESIDEARSFSRLCDKNNGLLTIGDYGGIGRWRLRCEWQGEGDG
jgi:hypothetical protein